MGNQKYKLTKDNQGYWDRIRRARSWVARAQALESLPIQADGDAVFHEIFISYWIAFNALYGRLNETGHGRYLRPDDSDAQWFLHRICDLDAGPGRILSALNDLRKEARALLKSKYLSETYWREGYSSNVKHDLEYQTNLAEENLAAGDVHAFLTILLWKRIRMVRNQVFHGCSMNRDSLNKDTLDPALRVLRVVIPLFIEIMEERIDKQNEWPRIPFPRRNSPQNSESESSHR